MHPAVKVARIAGASRHSRLETEPMENAAAKYFPPKLQGDSLQDSTKKCIDFLPIAKTKQPLLNNSQCFLYWWEKFLFIAAEILRINQNMITIVCTNIPIALRLLEKVPYNSTSTKITLTLFYVKSNINVSCLDSTVIDVKAKCRHESRSLRYCQIFLHKALVFIELSSNISLWAVVLKW